MKDYCLECICIVTFEIWTSAFLLYSYIFDFLEETHAWWKIFVKLQPKILFNKLFFSFFCTTCREEDKNIFDYCRENNIDHVSEAISSQKVDVNTKDEEVPMKPGPEIYRARLQSSDCRKVSKKHCEGGRQPSVGKKEEQYFADAQVCDYMQKLSGSPKIRLLSFYSRPPAEALPSPSHSRVCF